MHKLRYMVLAGPTAVGKTDLAIRVAQGLQTEIVGGDAFQLYQHLDILTGKPTLAQLAAVPHHLVGIIPLTDLCDVHKYSLLARQTIATLNQRGIIPLVVGGTGFYLQSLEGVGKQFDPRLRAGAAKQIERKEQRAGLHTPVPHKPDKRNPQTIRYA